MSSAFVGDGYERTDTIPQTRRHPEVTITYRPALRSDRAQLVLDNGKLLDKGGDSILKAHKNTSSFIAKRIVKWDITRTQKKTVDGESVDEEVDLEITPENVAKLEPNLVDSIFRCVAGYDDDKDVEAVDATRKRDAEEAESAKN